MYNSTECLLSCVAPFCQALHQITLNLLTHFIVLPHAMQILFNHNSQQGILDLLAGNVDVALARADVLSDMQTSGLIQSMDLFKCITAVSLFLSTNSFAHASAYMHASCESVNMH